MVHLPSSQYNQLGNVLNIHNIRLQDFMFYIFYYLVLTRIRWLYTILLDDNIRSLQNTVTPLLETGALTISSEQTMEIAGNNA